MSPRPTPEQKEILDKLKLRRPIYDLTLVRTRSNMEPAEAPEKDGRLTNLFADTYEEIPLATIKDMLAKGFIVEGGSTATSGYSSRENNTFFFAYRVSYRLPLKKYTEKKK